MFVSLTGNSVGALRFIACDRYVVRVEVIRVFDILNYPLVVFVVSFLLLWLAAWVGGRVSQRRRDLVDEVRPDYGTVLAATLTLLGLIIGFSFSMATGRYDLRKTYEEAEANAIGTEYIRAQLLPAADAETVRDLLRQYTDLRIKFYRTRRGERLDDVNTNTAALQDRMWAAVSRPAMAQQTPVVALAVAGMNDVINSQGYTQAAWWNRIPIGGWIMMFVIAVVSNLLLGYGARRLEPKLFMVLPAVVAVAFFLIADIDSPRGGMIRVVPQNLISLRAGMGQ
jgi:hypothetical protein